MKKEKSIIDFLNSLKTLILPHQDDEVFCYSLLDKRTKVVILIKGGGEPKGYTLDPEELYNRRCAETLKTCKEMGVSVEFFKVCRPYTENDLDLVVKSILENDDSDVIITTSVVDKHPDHKAVSKAVMKYVNKPMYSFIVQTDALREFKLTTKPDVEINLGVDEYAHKVKLVDNYVTQKHFLPNIVRRKECQTESFWRVNGV